MSCRLCLVPWASGSVEELIQEEIIKQSMHVDY
jgi:hypothetical protein